MSNKTVFISYSHDSAEHRERVLALSERLREDGIETALDQYLSGTPKQGWPRWTLDQLDAAVFVLVVCTETYYRQYSGHEEVGKGKDVDWEGALIRQKLHERPRNTRKFVPVFLSDANTSWIPEPLRGGIYYTLTSEPNYNDLYYFLLGHGVEAQAVGTLKTKPRKGTPLTFGNPVSAVPPLTNHRTEGAHPILFLCYRREDTSDAAGRLHDRLVGVYGLDGVFMDIDSVPLGIDFVDHVSKQISKCRAVIVMIGKQWIKVKDKRRRRRLDNEDDLVRAEIASALQLEVPVIPVLVQDAAMPSADELPENIRLLARRNGISLSADHWRTGVERLIKELDPVMKR